MNQHRRQYRIIGTLILLVLLLVVANTLFFITSKQGSLLLQLHAFTKGDLFSQQQIQQNLQENLNSGNDDLFQLFQEYENNLAKHAFYPNLQAQNWEELTREHSYQVLTIKDTNFLQGKQYIAQRGKPKLIQYGSFKLTNANSSFSKQVVYPQKTLQSGQDLILATGTANAETVKQQVQTDLQQLLQKIVNLDNEQSNEQITYKATTLQIEGVKLNISGKSNLQVGEVTLSQKDCPKTLTATVTYLPTAKTYNFANTDKLFAEACNRPPIQPTTDETVTTLDCDNCWLEAVDKARKLASNYQPTNLQKTNLPGGGVLTQPTVTALQEMYAAAQAGGIDFKVVSAYRSYATQKNTFEYWVEQEMADGADKQEAKKLANEYSARPGHSEHQLGTTVDLGCVDCVPFANSPGNKRVYNWLEDNSYKFGFVISYPPGTEEVTGYRHEPWHLRYIGKQRANEFHKLDYLEGNGWYLSKFLLQHNYASQY